MHRNAGGERGIGGVAHIQRPVEGLSAGYRGIGAGELYVVDGFGQDGVNADGQRAQVGGDVAAARRAE